LVRPALAFLLLGALGCKAESEVELAAEPGTTLYAIVTLGPDGTLIGSTPLGPVDEARSFVTASDRNNLVVGYDPRDFGDVPIDRLRGEPLEVAIGCQGRLPAPRFVRALTSGGLDPASPEELPPLTTANWRGSCPAITPELFLSSGLGPECGELSCQPEITAIDRCRFLLDLEICHAGTLEAQLDPFGRVCVESTPTRSCSQSGDRAICGQGACAIQVTPYVPESPEIFTIAETQLPGPVSPEGFGDYVTGASIYRRGALRDLLPLEGEVVVVLDPSHAGPNCEAPSTAKLYFIGLDSMAINRVVDADRCQGQLQPSANGFFSTFVDGGQWHLGEYDRLGARLRAVGLSTLAKDPGGSTDTQSILDIPERGVIVVLTLAQHEDTDMYPDWSEIQVVDRESFTLRHVWRFYRRYLFLDWTSGDEVAVNDGERQSIAYVDLRMGTNVDRVVRPMFTVDNTLMRALYWGDRLLIPANESLFTLEPMHTRRSILHGRDLNLVGIHPWPKGPDARFFALAIGAAQADGARPTTGTFFDADTGTFAAGRWQVAGRIVTRLRTDAQGRIWVMVPELYQVKRLTLL
jgi:hypothetical protein